jgi:hypothetical protein
VFLILEKLKSKLKDFVSHLEWEDYALIALLIIYLFFQLNLLNSFKQLPSPIYGGDYYYSMGTVQHVMSGGNPLAGSNILGSEPGYFPLYPMLVSVVGWLFRLSAFLAMKYFSIIVMFASLIVFYLFSNRLFKNKFLALITIIIYLPLSSFPIFKYSPFTASLLLPAFFFGMLVFFNKRNLVSAIISGALLGLIGISHPVIFVAAVFFLVIFSLYILFFEHLQKKEKKWFFDKESFKKSFGKVLLFLIIIGVIAAIIAMLYWYKPIFVYHGKLPSSSVATRDFSPFRLQMQFVGQAFKMYFFDFSTPFYGLRSVLTLLGLLSLFFLRKYDSSKKFIVLVVITAFVGGFHLLITEPLLGTHFAADQLRDYLFLFMSPLLAGLALASLTAFVKKFKTYILILFLLALLIISIFQFNAYTKTDRWIAAGRSELPANLAEMQKWVLANTKVNDVFISTNELSFALNALTGRKEVSGRRAHNSMFLDSDKRYAAAAVMLYGNDTVKREELLKEYSVKYLYWDYYWMQSDFVFDKDGKLTSWFDPFMVVETPEYDAMVVQYNISVIRQHTPLDPTAKEETMRKYDALIILPNQFNMAHPWHSDLDNYLQEIWNYSQNGMVYSRIYKIVNVD